MTLINYSIHFFSFSLAAAVLPRKLTLCFDAHANNVKCSMLNMTDTQIDGPLPENNLMDVYFVYGIIGLLVFVALLGLFVLIMTSCCWCCCKSISCCCRPNRRSSYGLNRKTRLAKDQHVERKKTTNIFRRYPSDITDLSQLYESCPHLINNKATNQLDTTGRHSDTSFSTIHTVISPIPSADLLNSFIETGPSVNRPFSYTKNLNIAPPAIVSLDIARIPSSVDHRKTNSPSTTNIYETVLPGTPNVSASHRTTPIYEPDWTQNFHKLFMKKPSPSKLNTVSVINPAATTIVPIQPDLVSSIHYFQQKQHPYDKFLANRKTTTDSMRRANMLRKIKDDTAFLY